MVPLARRSRAGSTDICHSLSDYPLVSAESFFSSYFVAAGAHTAAAVNKRSMQRSSPLDPHHQSNAQEVTVMEETVVPMDPAMR
jgi:hypothetical protein